MSYSTVKDIFFNTETMKALSSVLVSAYPAFNQKLFLYLIFDQTWKQRGVKDRMHHISTILYDLIDRPYDQAIQILLDANKSLSFNYTHMIFPDFVEKYGIDHLDLSMQALKEFTSHSTSEFAVRPFIRRYGSDAMTYMYQWSKDENEHVRRLSSEGCRPLLPWSNTLPEFIKDPTPILPILEQLKHDEALYVQKSVGNIMNDISKSHPDLILKLCREWKQQQKLNGILNLVFAGNKNNRKNSKDKSAIVDFITTRACRTLLKQGNQEALEMFGVGEKEGIIVKNLVVLSENVEIGGKVDFEFELADLRYFDQGEGEVLSQQSDVTVVENLRRSKRLNIIRKQSENIQEEENTQTQLLELPVKKSKSKRGQQQIEQQNIKNTDSIQTSQESSTNSTKNNQLDSSFDSISYHLLRVEYKINYLKSNGTHSSKIFMLKNNYKLDQGTSIIIKSSQRMQQLSTRKHYPGQHYVEIMVNGISKAKTPFTLTLPKEVTISPN